MVSCPCAQTEEPHLLEQPWSGVLTPMQDEISCGNAYIMPNVTIMEMLSPF